jgi:hypothetical protein
LGGQLPKTLIFDEIQKYEDNKISNNFLFLYHQAFLFDLFWILEFGSATNGANFSTYIL